MFLPVYQTNAAVAAQQPEKQNFCHVQEDNNILYIHDGM